MMGALTCLALLGWLSPWEAAAYSRGRLGRGPRPSLHLDNDIPEVVHSQMRHGQCRNCEEAGGMVSRDSRLGFPSRPAAEQWAPRLKELGNAARAKPCEADKIAVAFERGFGFGSRMNAFIDEIFYAMYGNYSLALCGSKEDGFYQRILSQFFENVAELPVCTDMPNYCGETNPSTMWPGMMLSELLGSADPEYLVSVKGYLTRFALTPTAATNNSVRQHLEATGLYGSDTKKPYIGMHIRRGDKVTWEAKAVPATMFAEEAKKYLQNASAEGRSADVGTVYLASDDHAVNEEISEALGPKFTVLRQDWTSGMGNRGYEDAEEVIRIMADLEALVNAELFIGSASSNLGRLVYMLRGTSKPSITVDDDGKWLKRG